MMSSGSKYVAAVFAVLVAYFVYVWWFSPTRAIKRQLGELAARVSVPRDEPDVARLARFAQLRRHFSEDVHVTAGGGFEITTRDALLGALATLRPPPSGWDVQFVDVQVRVDSDATARAFMTVEVTGADARTGERTLDAREARLRLAKRDGSWVITTAESPQTLNRP